MAKKQSKVNLDDLEILSYNPRLISAKELERLKTSIKEHSEAIPESDRGDGYRLVSTITVNKQGNRIVGGHQRTRALQELGQTWIDERDITWVDIEPDSAHEKALNVTLNSDRVSGEWDQGKLDDLMKSIALDDKDLFQTLDLADLDIGNLEDITPSLPEEDEPEEEPDDEEPEDDEVEITKPTEQKPKEPENKEEDVTVEHKYKGEPGTSLTNIGETQEKPEQEEPIFDEEEQLFPISYAVTSNQRKTIVDAINKSKELNSSETSAEALEVVCQAYLDTHSA